MSTFFPAEEEDEALFDEHEESPFQSKSPTPSLPAGGPPSLLRKISTMSCNSNHPVREVSVGSWEPVVVAADSPVPTGLSMHVSVAWGDSVFIFGGYSQTGHRVNDFYEFNFSTKTWSLVRFRGVPPTPRDRMGGCVHGNLMYIFGGHDGSNRLGDCYVFDFVSRRWSSIGHDASASPTARHSCSLAALPEHLVLFGGFDGSYRNDVHVLDLGTHKWQKLVCEGNVPSPRYRSTLNVCGEELVCIAGHDGTRHLNDAYALNPDTATWKRILPSTGNLPLPRDSHTVVTYGDSLVVFGGSSGSAMNDVHELNMRTQTWIPLFPGGVAPKPRFCHTMVLVSGSKLVVYGGFDGVARRSDLVQLNINVGSLGAQVEVPASTLTSYFAGMVNNSEFADCSFGFEAGEEVFAHKLVLNRIPYFAELFAKQQLAKEVGAIRIEGIARSTFLLLLGYLYCEGDVVQSSNVVELFEAADRFGVDRLKAVCQNTMINCLDSSNAGSLFSSADKHNAAHLRALAFNYIVANFDEVSTTPDFEEMGKNRVDLVFEILKRRGALKL